ncbi:MAG: FHA domain-containing protein, partial [Aeromicrobium sp.]|uniref:FHA domain-containing protein n=1 Tax=Aeromicrobium sp. TaxID=1871063 RepID=UPI0039E5499B
MGPSGERLSVYLGDDLVAVLSPGQRLEIGRDASGLRIDDDGVSRRHARVVHDGGWALEDLGSTNGTWVAGQEIRRLPLTFSHEARLGDPDDGPLVRLLVVGAHDRRPAPAPPPAPAAPPVPASP